MYLIGREAFSQERDANLDAPITSAGDIESMTVFDNVFVPNERIFLNGEVDFAGKLALRFALYHRHSYTGCKPGIGDVIMGTTALLADYQNIKKQSHVKEKLAEMVSVAELTYAAGIAASVKSEKASSGHAGPQRDLRQRRPPSRGPQHLSRVQLPVRRRRRPVRDRAHDQGV